MLNFRAIKIFSWNYAARICGNYQITNLQIVLNVPKNPYLIKPPQKIPAKIPHPKKSCSGKFETPKNPLIIPVP